MYSVDAISWNMRCANEVNRGLQTSDLVLKALCNLTLNTGAEVMGFIHGDALGIDFLGYEVFI